MRIRLYSDLHNEFNEFVPPEIDSDVVVLAGDTHVGVKGLEWAEKYFKEEAVIYVLGNHEYYRQMFPEHIRVMRKAASEISNLTLLERDSITIGDIQFLGCTLWTDFELNNDPEMAMQMAAEGMNDYRQISYGDIESLLTPDKIVSYHKESLMWLRDVTAKNINEKTVIISHHAPSPQSLPPRLQTTELDAAYCSDLESVIPTLGATLWVHGHTHCCRDYQIGNTRVVCNARGYPWQEHGFKKDLVIDI